MVLGITLRRRKTREEPAPAPPTPSLPNISQTGLSPGDWPEGLVDIDAVKQFDDDDEEDEENGQPAYKTHFLQTAVGQSVPAYHRPFRKTSGRSDAEQANADAQHGPDGRKSIASMYSSNATPPMFSPRGGVHSNGPNAVPRRINRVPPKFNVMIAGGRGTGKTSFLRLFLNTCDISPTALESEAAEVKRFLEGRTKRTKALKALSIEVCEERHERIQLTLVDTVGLDFEEGKELELERGISGLMKYIDMQYTESLREESKVVRKNKGDNHIHLCIYLIDPDTIMRPAARRANAPLPFRAKSQTTVTRRDSLSSIDSTETSETSSDDEDDERRRAIAQQTGGETMCPAELRILKRISTRANILPVIARADTLSDARLALVRNVIRRELTDVDVGFGVFDPADTVAAAIAAQRKTKKPTKKAINVTVTPPPTEGDSGGSEDSDEERVPRTVIKLKSPRVPSRTLERSRSRRNMIALDEAESEKVPVPRAPGAGAVQSQGMAWPAQSRAEVAAMLPFAFMAPEEAPRAKSSRSKAKPATNGIFNAEPNGHIDEPTDATSITEGSTVVDSPTTTPMPMPPVPADSAVPSTSPPASRKVPSVRRRPSFKDAKALIRSPMDLKGSFTRKYRWGTIDVLDPAHCDFVTLRTVVLGTHMKALRNSTKEVLYEQFRTEKLLARRATQKFNDVDRQKMLQDLGV